MLNVVMTTMVIVAMGAATVRAVPVETASRPDAARGDVHPGERQATPPPPPATPPAPAPPSPRERATAAREAARAQAPRSRVFAGRMGPQHKGPWVEVTGAPLTASFTGSSGDVLELSNTAGTVVIVAARGGEGRIVARRKAGGRTETEATALLQRMSIAVSQHAQRVVVRAEPAGNAAMYRLDYEIALPKGMGVDVRNVSGSVDLSDVAGDVRVEALSGSITGRGLSRLRSMRTMSGDIMVEASTLVGDANLQTVSGSVKASALKASSLTLDSVSGDIQLKDTGCDRVNVRTINGNIEFASPAVGGGRYELKTHAGSIVVLTGVKSAGFEFEAQTFKGRVRSDVSAGGDADARQLSGRIGDGSAFFDLASFVGSIHIRK